MGARAGTLTPFEVPVRGGGDALARCGDVVVHPKTHRATGAPPLEASIAEHRVEALGLGLGLHRHRSGDRECAQALTNVAAAQHRGRGAQVLDPPVRARAEEHGVDGDVAHRRAGAEVHVDERAPGALARGLPIERLGIRHPSVDPDRLRGVRPPGHVRTELGGVDPHLAIERGARVGREGAPVIERALPVRAVRGMRTALDVRERGLVGRDHAGASARFDRHVAHRHAAFHRERADRLAAVLDEVAGAATDADAGDDPEDDVLGAHVDRRLAVDRHGHRLRPRARDRLRREHMLDVARSDAERDRAERAVRRGVAVAAHDHHAGLAEAELRPDDVHDALERVAHRIEPDAEFGAIARERLDLPRGDRIRDRPVQPRGGDVVIGGREGEVRSPHRAAGETQAVEGLRRGDLMDEMEVDVQEVRLAIGSVDDVPVPDLPREDARCHARSPGCRSMSCSAGKPARRTSARTSWACAASRVSTITSRPTRPSAVYGPTRWMPT